MESCYTAIILGKREIGETDRFYILYTREGGKVRAVARGVRKPRAKLAGHLETFNRGSVVVARSRGLGTVTSAVADWYGAALKSDAEALLPVSRSVAAFERLVDVGERDTGLFDLLGIFLESVDEAARTGDVARVPLVAQAFLFQTLDRLGYRIEVARSVATGEPLRPGGRYAFDFELGGIVPAAQSGNHSVRLGEDAIKLLRLFLGQSLPSIRKVSVDPSVTAETQRVLDGMLRWIA